MKIRTFANAAAVLALGLAAWVTPAKIQSQPLFDRVDVNLPYTVTIGDKTLQPGSYVIQQLRSTSGDSRVLLIYSDNGMRFETSAMTIPALDPNTARDTKVILHHFGNDYYFDKIWIQGKDYGYEFPLPDSVKARQNEAMQPVSVAATYSTAPATTNTQTTTSRNTMPPTTTGKTTTARNQNTMPPATTGNQTSAAQNQNTMPPATTGNRTSAAQNQGTMPPATNGYQTAQNQNTMPPATNRSTMDNNGNQGNANRSMPNTSAGWLMMLLSGGALSGAGLSLRRKR